MDELLLSEKELEAFDAEQRSIVVKLAKGFKDAADAAVTKAVSQVREELGRDASIDGLRELDENTKAHMKDSAKVAKLKSVWKNNGFIPGTDKRVEWKDLCGIDAAYKKSLVAQDMFSTDHPLLIPRVIGEVVKEAIEPNIVLTSLLQRINYQHGTQLTFPSVGAITAADIPEGGEYPERSLDFAGQVVATIGKSGVAIKMTEEMVRYSLYDVMSMHLRAAGRALIRWKEQKVADLITVNAGTTNTLFDNTVTTYSSTTGRDSNGAYNGTLTLDDLHKAYATMITRGFTPNTLIMNPFAWQIFADEALMRAFGFQNGGAMWQALQGAPGNATQWSNGGFGNGLLQNTTVSAPQNLATTMTQVPGLFPYPFRIVVTPYMPFTASNNTTDIILCDVSQLGVLVVDEEVVVDSWEDPARDIMKIKLRERYGLGSVNEGKGSGIIKGVSLKKSFDFSHNLQATMPITGLTNLLTGDANYTAVVGQS
jgi:hypothetical protein